MYFSFPGPQEFRLPNGAIYSGEFALAEGMIHRNGKGTFTDTDGTVYEGEWKLDRMHGTGESVKWLCRAKVT